MQRQICLLVVCVFLLAGCGGNATQAPLPTIANATVQPTEASTQPAANVTVTSVVPTLPPVTQAQRQFAPDATLPAPGTIVAAVTQDPDAGKVFDNILFVRTGGIAGKTLTIQISGDGTLTRDGVTSKISSDEINKLVGMIDALNFFGMQGIFTSPGTSPDVYQYQITIDRNGSSKTLDAQDGMTPPPLLQLFSEIGTLGETASGS